MVEHKIRMSKPLHAISASTASITGGLTRQTGANPPRLADRQRTDRSSLISATVVRGFARFADFATTTLLGLFIALAYVSEPSVGSNPVYLGAIAVTGLLTVSMFEVLGLYSIAAFTAIVRNMPRLVLGWTVAWGLIVAGVFFMKIGADVSRVWLAAWFTAGAAALVGERLVLAGIARNWMRKGRLYRRAVIYGGNEVTESVLAQLEADRASDIRIFGIFDDRDDVRTPRVISGYPVIGGLGELIAFARQTRVDLVIVALPMSAEARLVAVTKQLSMLPADIKMPAQSSAVRFSPRTYSRIGNLPMIDLCDKPITDWGKLVKSQFDVVVAAVALVLLAPIMLAVAAAIRLDSRGPVLFRQKRYGFNNELIEMLKFRSMFTDRCDAAAAKLVTKDDPRVTRVGRFIRKTSLDELPQLFNVLMGELSLVGPRPHALQAKAGTELYDVVVDGYFARHKVKPGITGWAQINGWRGETDTPEKIRKRVEHDLYYIENWSLFLDLYILVMTPFALIQTKNAY